MDYVGDDLIAQPLLVTGAAGYLGRQVLAQLKGRGIAALGTTSRPGNGLTGDLTDRDAVVRLMEATRPATVIHCAARVPKSDVDYSDERAARDSLRMVENLISTRACHIVFPSSMTVYRPGARIPVCEDQAADDLAGYAKGKRTAEEALLSAPDIKATVLRFPGLFGPPRRGGFIYNAALAFASNRTPQLPAIAPLWAAMHVDDAAQLCVRAASRGSRLSVLMNAGYPGRMSLCSVLEALASIFDCRAPRCDAPEFEMDLSRMGRELGLPGNDLASRLQELANWVRESARSGAATPTRT